MRIVLKAIFLFLIWPGLALAQEPPPVAPPADLPAQTSSTPNDPAPPDSILSPSPPPVTPMFINARPRYVRPTRQPPIGAGYAPVINVSTGFSVTNLSSPYSGRIALSGVNATFSVDSGKIFGAVLEVGYARSANVVSSGHSMDALTYLVGPVFHLSRGRLLSSYAEFLSGGARIAGPAPTAVGRLGAGHVHYPAWAAGGGAEYRLSRAFGLRVSVDYLHADFYNTSGTVRGQNDIRVVNSLVYYFVPSVRHRH